MSIIYTPIQISKTAAPAESGKPIPVTVSAPNPPPADTTPPAGDTTPPAGESTPPAITTTPTDDATTPTTGESTPPADKPKSKKGK